jgi:hypothetical protein
MNENEIDRLYHLITKIISLSLRDSNILQSSFPEIVINFVIFFHSLDGRINNIMS